MVEIALADTLLALQDVTGPWVFSKKEMRVLSCHTLSLRI